MKYSVAQPILFRHCDPAGIVFYPRYFEMINDTVERFFGEILDYPFSMIMHGHGVPMKTISVDFKAPSRLGEMMTIEMELTKLGRTSIVVEIEAATQDEMRFVAHAVLVHVGSGLRPEAWPDEVREKMKPYVRTDE